MNSFNKRAATRITMASLLLAMITSPIAWFVAQEQAEESMVLLAIEESKHLFDRSTENLDPKSRAIQSSQTITGGLFDIAEIYNKNGLKLAESLTEEGQTIESLLPKHNRPVNHKAAYESIKLSNEKWVMRIFIPLQNNFNGATLVDPEKVTGYFEGVRIVPAWQQRQMLMGAFSAALIAGLAALLCGLGIYPVIVHLSADNAKKAKEVIDSHIAMVEALGRAIAKRDSDTGAHNYRVAWIAARIAEKMGFKNKDMQALIAGSFLHDVGKIGIPDAILLKPGKLTEEEFNIMRTHVQQGEDIVANMGWLNSIHTVVAGHHEKWNGTGYPRQLKGEAIPLAARIFAMADVFDALCSKRPYKEPMSFDAAMAILEKDTGSHFDPQVMAIFKPMARDLFNQLNGCDEEKVKNLLSEFIMHHFNFV
jgi:HD-GYP domain-containing protein (c-di-GMP phosphodiesterase class II)